MSVVISLRMADVQALRLAATGLDTLRALAGPLARPMGHDRTADYAFLAVDAKRAYKGLQEVTRSFVFLPEQRALVEFDIAIPADPPVPVTWKLEGSGSVVTLLSNETQFLHLIQTAGRQAPGKIDSDDLAGLRLGSLAILFYTETHMARSAVSFDVAGPTAMKFLIAGLAPGEWEIWRAGMREIDDGAVAPESGVLYFEGKPGGYFLRHV
jgi:Heparinase II C-terminal domain